MLRLADLDDVTGPRDEDAALGPGRLDGGLHDDSQKLVGIVGGGERVAEPREGVAQALALGLELVEPRLELVGHLVERPSQDRQLVAPPHRNALAERAAGDRVRRDDQAADRAQQRTALQRGDDAEERDRQEQAEEVAAAEGPVRRVLSGALNATWHRRSNGSASGWFAAFTSSSNDIPLSSSA